MVAQYAPNETILVYFSYSPGCHLPLSAIPDLCRRTDPVKQLLQLRPNDLESLLVVCLFQEIDKGMHLVVIVDVR